uniref:Transposon protein, putative, Pong sub-class n=2 Tax=Oryza sativa subsp. japonica TaxID=39947 RepID=Q53LY4_ORYSJ|nr:transposon protein, putative, ping/pong/SNOOPY sub-class [Oryza sativa Japonica Group]ABA92302.2 transposon protein, putative, Pong sub-class [Oryza sativa Japonica Group]
MSNQSDGDSPTHDDSLDEVSSIDPMDLYPLDEISNILGDLADHVVAELKSEVEALQDMRPTRQSGPRRYVDRPYEESKHGLLKDYFVQNPVYNDTTFRRRFRMKKHLFLRIVEALGQWDKYFTLRMDALNRPGLSPLKKCTSAICQLGNGSPADQLDEYLNIGDSTTVECLKMFVKGVIEVFGAEYLRRPMVQDVERLVQIGERRGFPGMLGSIDCMHWHWEKCPVAWKEMYTRGNQGVPTVILEAVASHDRWIWHAFFGVAGSNNDINVLNQSPLFVQQLRGEGPQVQYHVNGRQYNTGYYLADGIYPEWAVFVKSIRHPQSEKHKLFAKHQEGKWKDVECAFGILQSRFSILKRPARLYDQGDLENIMLACIILHNMIKSCYFGAVVLLVEMLWIKFVHLEELLMS